MLSNAAPGSREVLSLEEMLAEGDSNSRSAVDRQNDAPPSLNKTQIKCLQEAMYHSAENNHLDITIELRALGVSTPYPFRRSKRIYFFKLKYCGLGTMKLSSLSISSDFVSIYFLSFLKVPWTLHCWMHALAAAHELRLDAVIDQLLQDFLQVCPDDYSTQFVSECLPLLFNIFRYSKVILRQTKNDI